MRYMKWRRAFGRERNEVLVLTTIVMSGFLLGIEGQTSGSSIWPWLGLGLVVSGLIAINLSYLSAFERSQNCPVTSATPRELPD